MTATAVETAPITRARASELIAEACALRDAGMAQAEENASDWDKALYDQAIGWMAQTGQPFSANDIRDLLPPDINCRGLAGGRFSAAYTRQEIRPVGERSSLKPNTHNKRINVWVGAWVDDTQSPPVPAGSVSGDVADDDCCPSPRPPVPQTRDRDAHISKGVR
ncbi:hypothetical protein [Nocardioides sp.]|uniref:hypothetical protein n=1 Tax=Nocardioides sp. TaxID=35761 RepID=UPI00261661E2|nr:hypothetical protein [Nocardioides sp.]MDI6911455.1 hypothetical protein [Nocardioides sp.]